MILYILFSYVCLFHYFLNKVEESEVPFMGILLVWFAFLFSPIIFPLILGDCLYKISK